MLPRFNRKIFISAISAFLVLLVGFVGINGYQFFQNHKQLPPVKVHTDIASQPMRTFSQSLSTNAPDDSSQFPNSSCTNLPRNWVEQENLKPGVAMTVSDWKSLDLEGAQGSALWLNKTSGSCGETVDIHASIYGSSADTFKTGTRSIEALRIGWYQGSGARQVWNSGPLKLKEHKINYPRSATRMIQTSWPTTLRVKIGSDWVPGFYLFISRSHDGTIENVAPFILHAPIGSSKLMVMHSFLTWNIYNSFGGRSGYFGSGATKVEMRADRSRVVSLDRPIVGAGGFAIHRDAISIVQFLEKQGINSDQFSDLDVDSWPSIATHYSGIVLGGHPEYFTRRIFDTLISARNSGINIAILGGNTGIWQVRTTSSKIGPKRRVVIYRKAVEDPVKDLKQISIKFDDKRLNIPSTLLTGTATDGVHVYGNLKAIHIPHWLKLPPTSSINGISPDSEVGHIVPTVASPPNVNILFSGTMHYRDAPTVGQPPLPTPISQVVWFTTPSGAAIFNAGITTWSCDLIQTCAYSTVDESSRAVMDSVTTQILHLWQTKAVGKTLAK
jgi:hypothetical protein